MSTKSLTRREFLRAAGTTTVGLVAAACAPSVAPTSAPTTAPAAGPTALPPTATPAPHNPVTLQFWQYDYGRKAAFDATGKVVAAFQKEYPWIKVEYNRPPFTGFTDAMTTAIRTGTAPDVAEMYQSWALLYREMGELAPVTATVKKIGESQYSQAWKDICTDKQGQWYGVPLYAFPNVLWYRKDWFSEAGIEPPKTWADMIKIAKDLTVDTNKDGKVDRYGLLLPTNVSGSDADVAIQFATATNNCYILDQNLKPIVNVGDNGKRFVESLNYIKTLYQWQPEGATTWSTVEARPYFAKGIAAAFPSTVSFAYNIATDFPDLVTKMATVPWPFNAANPAAKSRNFTGGYTHCVLKGSKHPEEAQLFVEFHHRKEIELMYMTNTVDGWLPLRKEIASSDDYWKSPQVSKVGPIIRGGGEYASENGEFLGQELAGPNKWPAIFQARVVFGRMFYKLIIGNETPEAAAAWAQKEMETIISQG